MRSRHHINAPAAVLWASAFVIGALVIVQAGRLPGNSAVAEMASDRGEYTLLTANQGTGTDVDPDEVLWVIDSRDQVVLVYEIENAADRRILLRGGGSLDNLFRNAR